MLGNVAIFTMSSSRKRGSNSSSARNLRNVFKLELCKKNLYVINEELPLDPGSSFETLLKFILNKVEGQLLRMIGAGMTSLAIEALFIHAMNIKNKKNFDFYDVILAYAGIQAGLP